MADIHSSELYGGTGGSPFEQIPPERLFEVVALKIGAGQGIASLEIEWRYGNDAVKWSERAGQGGNIHYVDLGSEQIKGIEGTADSFVQSLSIITSTRRFGPFGEPRGKLFSIKVGADQAIVGFAGRAGSIIDAVGAVILTGAGRVQALNTTEDRANNAMFVYFVKPGDQVLDGNEFVARDRYQPVFHLERRQLSSPAVVAPAVYDVYFTWDNSGAQKYEVAAKSTLNVPNQLHPDQAAMFQYTDMGGGTILYAEHNFVNHILAPV